MIDVDCKPIAKAGEPCNSLHRTFVDDEGGFTSLGAAVAMLLAVALVVTATRVCWVESRASDIQFAADAGALASENVIAEYVTAAQVIDASVLSMSLLGLSLYAVSAVAACVPAVGAQIAAGTSKAAQAVMSARDRFASSATTALNSLQRALPFLCALNAMSVIQANGRAMGAPDMTGMAVALPIEGIEFEKQSAEEVEAAGEAAEGAIAPIATMATDADEAAKRMDEAKRVAYEADCGNHPGYCLYQRADTLAGLPPSSNPYYASIDAWSFTVPLERARSYYRARLAAEPGRLGGGDFSHPDEAVRSIARARYYSYAIDRLEAGTVVVEGDAVHADLPSLPRNTAEVRETALYTEAVWPLTSSGEVPTLHASASCPGAAGQETTGLGSVAMLDDGRCVACPICRFDASTLGSVAAASTSIESGFEHYWRIISQAAGDYSEASERYAEESAGAKRNVEDVLAGFERALSDLGTQRFDIQPPGRYGSIAVAIDPQMHEVPQTLALIGGGGEQMGRRMAVSAATLSPDVASSEDNLLSSLFAGLRAEVSGGSADASAFGAVAVGLLDSASGIWGELLFAYSRGTEGLLAGVDSILSKIPFVGSEFSEWAAARLKEVIYLLGIEPAELDMHKPVVCNTADVAARSDDGAAAAIARLRTLGAQMGSTGLYGLTGSVAATVRSRFDARMDEGFTVRLKLADIEGFPDIPITIKLPRGVRVAGDRAIDDAADALQAWTVEMGALERAWR